MVDLLQLRYFQAVAHHQHVSRAAADLHIAQPALSRSIARLETELGVPLFDRHGRRVQLNRLGALFLAPAARAIRDPDQGPHQPHPPPPPQWAGSPPAQLAGGGANTPLAACEGEDPPATRGLSGGGGGRGVVRGGGPRSPGAPPVAWLHLEAPACRRTLSLVWRTD